MNTTALLAANEVTAAIEIIELEELLATPAMELDRSAFIFSYRY